MWVLAIKWILQSLLPANVGWGCAIQQIDQGRLSDHVFGVYVKLVFEEPTMAVHARTPQSFSEGSASWIQVLFNRKYSAHVSTVSLQIERSSCAMLPG